MDYRDKVVVVTGASSGIGRETALAFARRGARLALASRNEAELVVLSEQISGALVVPTDVTSRPQVEALVEKTLARFGRIDVLVNNAGVGLFASVEEMKPQQWERVLAVNLAGAIHCIQAVLPGMKKNRTGQIINISSILGKRAMPYMSVYSASKFALNGLSEALRVEVAGDRIDVIVVCPGRTRTAFQRNAMAARRPLAEQSWAGMPAARCAEAIVRAASRRKREVWLTTEGILFVKLSQWFPALMDWALARMARREERRRKLRS